MPHRGSALVRRGSALFRSTHPGPGIAVTLVAALLGVAVGLAPWRVVVLGAAMLLDQASVGLSNDWIDADRDRAVGRSDKPVARGEIPVGVVSAAAWLTAGGAVLMTLPLGPAATAAHVVALGSAWAYNTVLKNSAVSVLTYALSFGLLPGIATLARPVPALPVWWAVAAGALLGVAAHFANVLPDLDDDRQTGIRGLPHRLGLRPSIVITWGSLVVAAGAIAAGGGGNAVSLTGFAISLAIGATGLVLALRRGVGRWLFRLVIAAALIDVTMLVLAGSRLVA